LFGIQLSLVIVVVIVERSLQSHFRQQAAAAAATAVLGAPSMLQACLLADDGAGPAG